MKVESKSAPLAVAGILLAVFAVLEAQPMKPKAVTQEEDNIAQSQGGALAIAANLPEAPMAIELYGTTRIDPYDPKVPVRIINKSDKPISAYAVKYEVVVNGKLSPGGLELTQISSARSLLQPGNTSTVTFEGTHYSQPIQRFVVTIDFVEFIEGKSWGADAYSSRLQLEGMRAGARYASEQFLRLAAAKGPKTLSTVLEQTDNDLLPPTDFPEKWREGFARGVAFVRERAKREIKEFSQEEIIKSLSSPIDALDEIRRGSHR